MSWASRRAAGRPSATCSGRAKAPRSWNDVAPLTPESTALSKELKRRGFRFVGPTTVYALMQACGLVNDHLAGCRVRAEVERAEAILAAMKEAQGKGLGAVALNGVLIDAASIRQAQVIVRQMELIRARG